MKNEKCVICIVKCHSISTTDLESEKNKCLYTPDFILVLLSTLTPSIKTDDLVLLAAVRALTLPPLYFIDNLLHMDN